MSEKSFFGFGVLALFVVSGLLSVMLGQDINGDQLMYHSYTAYALLKGRLGVDIAAGGLGSFNNPLQYIPFYYAIAVLPAKLVGFLIGALQSLNLVAVYLIAARLMQDVDRRERVIHALLAALLAALLPSHQLEIGRTFGDNWSSLPFLFGFLGILCSLRGGWGLLIAGGLLVGVSGGLKLTNAVPCLALGLAYALCQPNLPRILGLAAAMAGGFLVSTGYWFVLMAIQWGNPLFPLYNSLFHSPYYGDMNWRDERWKLHGLEEFFRLPWSFVDHGDRLMEGPYRDARWLVFFPLLLLVGLGRGIQRRLGDTFTPEVRLTVLFVLAGFVMWAVVFHYARYLLIVEYVAQALLVWLLLHLALRPDMRLLATGACVAAVVATTMTLPYQWARQSWSQHWYSVEDPGLPAGSVVLLGNGMGGLVGSLPADARYIGIGSNYFFTGGAVPSMFRKIQETIDAAGKNIYHMELLSLPRPDLYKDLDAVYGTFGLSFGPCRTITSNISTIRLCSLIPGGKAPLASLP